jgi:helix-turn-helix protein
VRRAADALPVARRDEFLQSLARRLGDKPSTLALERGITPHREGERAERGEATLDEGAAALDVSAATVRRMINEGLLPAHQLCKGAPWVIRTDDLGIALTFG